jgi:hypothetical protein
MKNLMYVLLLFMFAFFVTPADSMTDNDFRIEVLVRDHYIMQGIDSVLLILYKDQQPLDSVYTDTDGGAAFSLITTSILTPNTSRPDDFTMRAFPNPFLHKTRITFYADDNSDLEAVVHDITGRQIFRSRLHPARGRNELLVNLSSLLAGVYFLHINGSVNHFVKLVKTGDRVHSQEIDMEVTASLLPATDLSEKSAAPVYTITAHRERYGPFEITVFPSSGQLVMIELERSNEVAFFVIDENQQPVDYTLYLENGASVPVHTPDTLFLASGIYEVYGETDTCMVAATFELASRDTTLWLVPGKKEVPPDDTTALALSSSEVIYLALERGEIDLETSLLYRAYTLVGDPRLPPEYNSYIIDLDDGTMLALEVEELRDSLSQETRDILHPFFLRPNDPESIYSIMLTALEEQGKADIGKKWISMLTAGGAARVWLYGNEDNIVHLSNLAAETALVWETMYENDPLINLPRPDEAGNPSDCINPDNAIDIYFMPNGLIDSRYLRCYENPNIAGCRKRSVGGARRAPPIESPRKSSGYAIIDINASGSILTRVLAHELFHISQFSYNYETRWLMESTAVWAEFNVLRRLGVSTAELHNRWLPVYYHWHRDQMNGSDLTTQLHYASYIYPLFLQMHAGGEGHRVAAHAFEKASQSATKLCAAALDFDYPFREHFRMFALTNWNQDPVNQRYRDYDPNMPDLTPEIYETFIVVKEDDFDIEEQINPLSTIYYSVKMHLEDDNNWLLKFDLEDYTANPDAGIHAIVTIDGKDPEIFDWSEEEEVRYCLDIEEERVVEIILILSNASLDTKMPARIGVQRIEPCEYYVTYDTEISWQWADMITYQFHYYAKIYLDRVEEGGTVRYEGTDVLEVKQFDAIPGECSATTSVVHQGEMTFTFHGDLTEEQVCEGLMGVLYLPVTTMESMTLICDEYSEVLPAASYGWSAWLTAHAMTQGETGLQLLDWSCSSEEGSLVASKEYSRAHSMSSAGQDIVVRVTVELHKDGE